MSQTALFVYLVVILINGLAMVFVAGLTWQQHHNDQARLFVLCALLTAAWLLLEALTLTAITPALGEFFHRVLRFTMIAFLPAAYLFFFVTFLGVYPGRKPAWLWGFVAVPTLTMLLNATNPLHQLFIRQYELTQTGSFMVRTSWEAGPWFYIHTAACLLMYFVALGYVVRYVLAKDHAAINRQSIAIVAGVTLPVLASLLDALQIIPGVTQPLAPLSFGLLFLGFGLAAFRYRLLNIVPVAYDKAIQSMTDAVIVLDDADRVRDLNPPAVDLLGTDQASAMEKPLSGEVGAALAKHLQHLTEAESTLTLPNGRAFEYTLSQVLLTQGGKAGRLLILHEITDRLRVEEALRAAKERYDRLVNSLPGMAYILRMKPDGSLCYDFVSDRVSEMHGVSPEQVYSNPDLLLSSIDMAALNEYTTAEPQAAEEPQLFQYELPRVVNGERVWHQHNATVERLPDGSVVWHAIELDITKQKEAQARAELLGRAIDESPFPMALADASKAGMPLIYVNEAFTTVTGYTREEVLGGNCSILQAHDRAQPALDVIRRALREQIQCRVLLRNYRKDGTLFWNRLTLAPVSDGRGRVTHFVGIQNDLTDLITMQEELKQSERQFRALFEQNNDAVFIIDLDGNHIRVNRRAVAMLGYTQAELEQMNTTDIVAPTDQDDAQNRLDDVYIDGELPIYERYFRRKDGTVFPVEVNVSLIRDADGRPRHIQSIVRDITDRKRIFHALQHREQLYRMLARNLPDMSVMIFDKEMRFEIAEGPFLERLGFSKEAIEGRLPHEFIGETQVGFFLKSYQAVLDGEMVAFESTLRGYTYEAVMLPIVGEGGAIQGGLVVSRDITEERQHQEELRRAKEAAESANVAKSRFLANMSHELRTPLNAVLGFSELLIEDENLWEDQRDQLHIIMKSGEHLLGVINDVLEISKIEAGRIPLREDAVDLHALFGTVRQMFQPEADRKKLAFDLQIVTDVPTIVYIDEVKFRQVCLNLIGNAFKFTRQGRVTARASYDPAAEQLRVAVSDTGPGIPLTEQEHLFKPFVQASAGQAAGSGAGLGLAIAREYVYLMGGDITVESTPAVGTTFTFTVRAPTVMRFSEQAEDGGVSRASAMPVPAPQKTAAALAAQLTVLPPPTFEQLRRAVAALDTAAAQDAITSISVWDDELSHHLADLVKTYRFDQIADAIEQITEE